MTPEGRVKDKVRSMLRKADVMVVPLNMQGIGQSGLPDDMVVARGRVSFIEYKAMMRWDKVNATALATLPTPLQAMQMNSLVRRGIRCYVVDSANMTEFLRRWYANEPLTPFVWDWSVDGFTAYREGCPVETRWDEAAHMMHEVKDA